jgi:hypothetical protein
MDRWLDGWLLYLLFPHELEETWKHMRHCLKSKEKRNNGKNRGRIFSPNDARTIDAKDESRHRPTPFSQINSKWIIDLNINCKTTKTPTRNMGTKSS